MFALSISYVYAVFAQLLQLGPTLCHPTDCSPPDFSVSSLITSNLPWFMDLTVQVPMKYYSLQHRTLHSLPDTATTEYHFHFCAASSLFLKLFLWSYPVAYWTPINLGGSSSNVTSFCPFILIMEFLRQEYWSGLPFPFPVDHFLSDGNNNK